jgi:hypothetical protein
MVAVVNYCSDETALKKTLILILILKIFSNSQLDVVSN